MVQYLSLSLTLPILGGGEILYLPPMIIIDTKSGAKTTTISGILNGKEVVYKLDNNDLRYIRNLAIRMLQATLRDTGEDTHYADDIRWHAADMGLSDLSLVDILEVIQ